MESFINEEFNQIAIAITFYIKLFIVMLKYFISLIAIGTFTIGPIAYLIQEIKERKEKKRNENINN